MRRLIRSAAVAALIDAIERSAVISIRSIGACALVSAALAGLPVQAQVTSPKLATVRIAERVGDINYAPVHLANALGFFKREGVDAKFIQFDTGGLATKAVVAGQADVCTTTYGGMILADVQGAGLTQTVLLSSAPGLVLLVGNKSKVTDAKAIKGMTIGVSGLGTPPEFFVRSILHANGMISADVKLASTGNGVPAVTALTMDRVQALVQFDPLVTRMVSDGQARVLIDTRTLKGTEQAFGGPYVGGNIAGTQGWVKANAPTVKAMNKAIVRTLKWMQSHSAAQIVDALPHQIYYPNPEDKALMVKAFEASKDFYSGDGTLSAAAAKNVVRNLKIANPKLDFEKLDLAVTYDNALVKE
jgi:NitT/TauT family transport system substrate-binding protein